MDRFSSLALLGLLLFSGSFPAACAAASNQTIATNDAKILGIKLHYTMAGQGPTVIWLYGYAETSRMWTPILPVLAERFTVIAAGFAWQWGLGDPGRP